LQWLQDPSQTNGDRRETNRTFSNKKREYQKEKLMSLNETVRTKISETYIEG